MRKVNKAFKIGISKKNGEKINDINEIEFIKCKCKGLINIWKSEV